MHVYDAPKCAGCTPSTYTNLDAAPPGFHTARQLAPARARLLDSVPPSMISSRAATARAALIDTVRVLPADNVLPELAQPARYWFRPDRKADGPSGRRHGLRRIETVVPEGFNRPRERRVLCFRANNGTNGPHGRQARRGAAAKSQLKDVRLCCV